MGGRTSTAETCPVVLPRMPDWKPVSSPSSEPVVSEGYVTASAQRAHRAFERLLADPFRRERITHVEIVPAREGRRSEWPSWLPEPLTGRLGLAGIEAPWE